MVDSWRWEMCTLECSSSSGETRHSQYCLVLLVGNMQKWAQRSRLSEELCVLWLHEAVWVQKDMLTMMVWFETGAHVSCKCLADGKVISRSLWNFDSVSHESDLNHFTLLHISTKKDTGDMKMYVCGSEDSQLRGVWEWKNERRRRFYKPQGEPSSTNMTSIDTQNPRNYRA